MRPVRRCRVDQATPTQRGLAAPRWVGGACVALVLVLMALAPSHACADGPDYAVPGAWALPWAYGDGHRVTWTPEGHWENMKASGVAYDIAMPEGTALFAPCDGEARFALDERPFDTNLGNYVEVSSDGWLLRLAHLRDPQSGQRAVHTGELIGYSGSSGVAAPHLHLEVFAQYGARWVRPELDRLERLFGLPVAELVEEALITNRTLAARVVLEGRLTVAGGDRAAVGQGAELQVPLRNHGTDPLGLSELQVQLHSSSGTVTMQSARGAWVIAGRSAASIPMEVRLPAAGLWHVGRVVCQTEGGETFGLVGQGELAVDPAPLRLVGVTYRPIVETGERITLSVRLENASDAPFVADDLALSGTSPDKTPWRATLAGPVRIAGHDVAQFTLRATTIPHKVGTWKLDQIGFCNTGHWYALAPVHETFAVFGPQLTIQRLSTEVVGREVRVELTVRNLGTRLAAPDRLEVWGWEPDGERHFALVSSTVPATAPGETTRLELRGSLQGTAGLGRLVEAGYWSRGDYVRLGLPDPQDPATEPH